ncbi:MAG: PIG-L deacetylase family protein [Anaerovoracaceae bacterium]|jgi:LmbE family N-acetylglucosaminyl deacetylase
MKINPNGEIYIPFEKDMEKAFKDTTHLAISAHQDDVEIMAQHGILTCFGKEDQKFSAVVCSDGAGSPRSGIYADYSNEEMMAVRRIEQKKAACVGNYASLFLLNYPSSIIKDGLQRQLIEDLKTILLELKPEVIYTHNPGDKHDTHVAVCLRVITALKEISRTYRPKALYGCEVWRSLDWINDNEKEVLDVSGHPALRASLLGVFDSQIAGGKRYDLAAQGRFLSNATFFESHATDDMDAASYAIDLMPLIDGADAATYMREYIQRFATDVEDKINRMGG